MQKTDPGQQVAVPMENTSIQNPQEDKNKEEKETEDESEPEDASGLAYSYADHLSNDKIEKYISNKGAYTRGGGILGTLYDLKMSGSTKKLTIACTAKGTANEPYSVYVTMTQDQPKHIGNDII